VLYTFRELSMLVTASSVDVCTAVLPIELDVDYSHSLVSVFVFFDAYVVELRDIPYSEALVLEASSHVLRIGVNAEAPEMEVVSPTNFVLLIWVPSKYNNLHLLC
jgi:hypothetical protein